MNVYKMESLFSAARVSQSDYISWNWMSDVRSSYYVNGQNVGPGKVSMSEIVGRFV